jgi:hypothetical protein
MLNTFLEQTKVIQVLYPGDFIELQVGIFGN